jgi:hypothetical protein
MVRVMWLASLALGVALGGCSLSGQHGVAIFADPGAYQYHSCVQLSEAAVRLNTRREDLKRLIDAAEQSALGTAMGVLAYRGEYQTNGEELAMIEATATSKSCVTERNWRSNTVIR